MSRLTAAEAARRLPHLQPKRHQPRTSSDFFGTDSEDDDDETNNGNGTFPDSRESPNTSVTGDHRDRNSINSSHDSDNSFIDTRNVDNGAGSHDTSNANGHLPRRLSINDVFSDDSEGDVPLAQIAELGRSHWRPTSQGRAADSPSSPPQFAPPLRSPRRGLIDLQSTASSELGERRYTAAEKGKGRAVKIATSPLTVGTDSDIDNNLEPTMDDSIQFIASVPPADLDSVDEPPAVIDAESNITGYSELTRTCPLL
jgi:hypothetical protein